METRDRYQGGSAWPFCPDFVVQHIYKPGKSGASLFSKGASHLDHTCRIALIGGTNLRRHWQDSYYIFIVARYITEACFDGKTSR